MREMTTSLDLLVNAFASVAHVQVAHIALKAYSQLAFRLMSTMVLRAYSAELLPRLYVLHGVIPSVVQDFVFVEFHEVPISLFLQHLGVPPLLMAPSQVWSPP